MLACLCIPKPGDILAEQQGGQEKFNLWQALKEAFGGAKVDYTQGPLNRLIILLAVPMMLEMALESVFAVVDIFWVSHLGENAVAAVGLA